MRLRKCNVCGKYTLKQACDAGHATSLPKPAKYSPEDTYGRYRRKIKKETLKEKGLL